VVDVRRRIVIALTVGAVLLLAACAPGTNQLVGTESPDGSLAGFWPGLWHGFIALFTFVISLFTDEVSVYEVHNTGGWYDFGFVLGVMIFFSGGTGSGAASRRKRA
jgi:hypothetical protein